MTQGSSPTAIATSFGFDSTAAEVVKGINLSGKRAVVTGGSSGFGIETARAVTSAGADVTLAVRDTDAGQRTAAGIIATTGNDPIHVRRLDLADQASIAEFVSGWAGPLHLLINNAGVMGSPQLQLTMAGRCTSLPITWDTSVLRSACATHLRTQGCRDCVAELRGTPTLARDLRRSAIRLPQLQPVARLRAVQDSQRPIRGRGRPVGGRTMGSRPMRCTPERSVPTWPGTSTPLFWPT